MNKKNIIQYITGIKENENEGLDIVDAIEDAKAELEAARSTFDNVQDSKLIELAIYAEKDMNICFLWRKKEILE